MLKSLIILPDGTELFSGAEEVNAIQSITLTECVNSGEDLTLGSACAAVLEATVITPGGNLTLNAGEEITLYQLNEAGEKTRKGIFILEKPTRPSANTVKLTGYDRIIQLDKDMTAWLEENLAEPAYNLMEFAREVCKFCGLTLVTEEIPNGDFPVPRFSYSQVTGRELMKWIGEISCRFCRANADGNIELAWYEDSHKEITPTSQYRYFAKGLSYETYTVAPIDGVQIRLADNENGGLFPDATGMNPYVISGNPILQAEISPDLLPYLQVMRDILRAVSYTPCKVSLPANLEINAGSIVKVKDINGKDFTAYMMTKTTAGQKNTLECTGNHHRNAPAAVAKRKAEDRVNELLLAVKHFDGDKIASLINLNEDGIKIQGKQLDLTGITIVNEKFKVQLDGSIEANAGKIGGCEINKDGKLIVPVAHIDGTLEAGKILVKDANKKTLLSAGDNKVQIAGWNVDENSFYSGNSFSTADCFFCTGSYGSFQIGDFGAISSLVLKAGSNFGVTKDGILYANEANLSGYINAKSGKIGNWDITEGYLQNIYSSEEGTLLKGDRVVVINGGKTAYAVWLDIVKAANAVIEGQGTSDSFSVLGKTYTFTNGILTNIS